jgi:hypothetical protein
MFASASCSSAQVLAHAVLPHSQSALRTARSWSRSSTLPSKAPERSARARQSYVPDQAVSGCHKRASVLLPLSLRSNARVVSRSLADRVRNIARR